MKLITLENVLRSLQDMAPEVKVPQEIRSKVRAVIDRMLDIGVDKRGRNVPLLFPHRDDSRTEVLLTSQGIIVYRW